MYNMLAFVGHSYEVKLQVNMVMANQVSQDTVYKVQSSLSLSLSLSLSPPPPPQPMHDERLVYQASPSSLLTCAEKLSSTET